MGSFAVGDVVVVAFPYADFSRLKKRPAIVVSKAESNNVILCQVTSKAATSKRVLSLIDTDFSQGGLSLISYARLDKLFTVEPSVITGHVGSLHDNAINNIRSHIRQLFI